MTGYNDLTGKRFGKLTVIKKLPDKEDRYWLGTYRTFEEAVQVRLKAEELIHNGFLEAYYEWKHHADQDPQWGREHPLLFQVEKINGDLVIRK